MSAAESGEPGPFDGAVRREPAVATGPGRHSFAYAIIGLLSAASLICVALIAARSWYSHTYHYWFLLWNLVLAWVPFVFAAIAYSLASARAAPSCTS